MCFSLLLIPDFLKSHNGNRRFWPVPTHVVKPLKSPYSINKYERDQIWAEAVVSYKNGEKLFLNDEMVRIATSIQNSHTEENPWVDIFEEYLKIDIPGNWYDMSKYEKTDFFQTKEKPDNLVKRERVCVYELWDIALQKREALDSFNLKIIRQTMARLTNWERDKEAVRFGTTYPRHRGSYKLKSMFNVLLN